MAVNNKDNDNRAGNLGGVPGGYDAELQMFVRPPREPNQQHLEFQRWLGERGLLEHSTAGLPTGEYVSRSAVTVGRALREQNRGK